MFWENEIGYTYLSSFSKLSFPNNRIVAIRVTILDTQQFWQQQRQQQQEQQYQHAASAALLATSSGLPINAPCISNLLSSLLLSPLRRILDIM